MCTLSTHPCAIFLLTAANRLVDSSALYSLSEDEVNKWLAAAGLALVILTGAMGLRTVASKMLAHTSAPVPPTPYYANTSAPVPPTPY